MLFNSIDFVVFLPVVFILYWFVFKNSLKLQNLLLFAASYFFYGWWDWRFLSLIFASTCVDYFLGMAIGKEEDSVKRKRFLWCSIMVNLGFLVVFKYYNFFIENFSQAFSFMGGHIDPLRLNIVLPIGISFYTFQTLSYSIDVYRRKITPTKDFISFSAFVSFFPQLVAGPIERASNLLPQFHKSRQFTYASAIEGMQQILWGFFKKIVIADNCAEFANLVFNNSADYSGSTLFLGALFFTFQIYGDFSGYSDIAIGTARLFGFNLMQNFAFPYFSRDIAEFWRRWHISLSTWFRDYLYIPLGGSRGSNFLRIRNTFIIFIVSGFWHGANWTFIIWGMLNAIYFLPLLLRQRNRQNLDIVAQGKWFPTIKEIVNILFTFFLTLIAWIFFRAENLSHALSFIADMFTYDLFTIPETLKVKKDLYLLAFNSDSKLTSENLLLLLFAFIVIEWLGREKQFALQLNRKLLNKPMRWIIYFVVFAMIIRYSSSVQQEFIYFQF